LAGAIANSLPHRIRRCSTGHTQGSRARPGNALSDEDAYASAGRPIAVTHQESRSTARLQRSICTPCP
jgi:hypothetical protein